MKKTASAGSSVPSVSLGVGTIQPPDLRQLEEDLDSMGEQDLRQRAKEIIGAARYYEMELASTRARFDEFRIRFADKFFESFPPFGAPGAGVVIAPPKQATIVATVQDDKLDEQITTGVIDRILGADSSGPVPQIVQRRDRFVYMSFADAVQSGKAKSILESDPAGTKLFQSVDSRRRLFPAVARSVDLSDLEGLRRDIVLRNDFLNGSLEAVKPLFRGRDGAVGHVKLLFNSASKRDEAVQRGRIYADGRRVAVTAVDWNREVKRCYQCQRYGHIARQCPSQPACGRCAGSHSPGQCNSAPKRCVNCGGPHISGDPSCNEQVKAVRRLKARFDE